MPSIQCQAFNAKQPFPLSEDILCYFVAMLAHQGLAIQSIKTYMNCSSVSRGQTSPTHPVFAKYCRGCIGYSVPSVSPNHGQGCQSLCTYCVSLKVVWEEHLDDFKRCARWTVTTLCFFVFFRPVRGDNNPTTVSAQLSRSSCLGGCGSGQSHSSELCQGPLEVIEMQ